jgi:hypothetical protein
LVGREVAHDEAHPLVDYAGGAIAPENTPQDIG